MPEVQKGILQIAGYSVDEGEWSSRVNVWGNEAVLRSKSSLPLTLNQPVHVYYQQGGIFYTLIQNGRIMKIEQREEGFEKYYEYTVWGPEWVGKYRISSETGSIEAATIKLKRYMDIIGLTPTFYNLSGVTIVPNAIPNEYISEIVDNIARSAYTYSTNIPSPVTIHYYCGIDGNPIFFVGTIGTATIICPLTLRERTEDLTGVYNQVIVWTSYHPIKDTFDLFTDTVQGNYKYLRNKSWSWEPDWTDWNVLSGDTTNKVYGYLALKTGIIPAHVERALTGPFEVKDKCNVGVFVRIPSNAGNLVASSLTGFLVVIGSSLNPKSTSGATSIDCKVKVYLGPEALDFPGDNKQYLSSEASFYATTVLTWHTISLGKEAFITKNKIKDEEMSSITIDYVHFQIESGSVWYAPKNHTPEEFTFWFDKGYLTEKAGTVVLDVSSYANYGLRELASEEIGYEPRSAKRYAELVAKGQSLLKPKPEQFYSRVEIPATIGPLSLGYYYTILNGSTMATGLLTEIHLEVREDDVPKWVLTLSSSPDYPARTKLYKKLEKLDTAVRYLLNYSPSGIVPVEGRIIPFLITSDLNAISGFVSNLQAINVPYLGSIGVIENVGSLNADYIGNIGSIGSIGSFNAHYIGTIDNIGNIGNANFQNIGNISQIGTIRNVSTMNVNIIGSIGIINTIGQANFGYVGNIGNIGYIGSIDRMNVNRIDNINSISNINYANIIQANITNLGALQNLQTAYLNVTNIATLVSATITNAYVTNISNINTLNANNLYVSKIGSIGTAYITNANITNISSLNSASIGIAYISIIQNVATLSASLANITNIQNVVSLNATTMNATNLFVSGIATIGQIQNVAIINAGSLSVSTISNVVSLVANTVSVNQVEKVGKIVALQTQIQIGEGAQNVYIPVPSTVYNIYGMPGATLNFNFGTVDTFLVGTISANSIKFTIGTVQTFYIGSASADVMKFRIGTVDNINVTVAATGASLGFAAGSIGNITFSSIATIYNLNVTNVGTIKQLDVTGIGHIGTFRLDAGTIGSAWITIGTISYATITATSVGTAYISISTIDSCTIKFGTITSLYAITENVSTLNVTVKGSLSYATISAAGIGGLYVSAGTLASCTITSGRIGNLSVSASTITKLEITTPLIGRGVIRADNLVFLPYNWFPNPSFEYVDENGQVIDWTNVTRAPGGVDGNYYGSIEPETYAWARATLDIETGEILRFKGYVLSEWYPAFVAKVLDSSYNPIATLRVFTDPASNWEYRSVQMTISTQGAKHVVPGLYVSLYPAGFDCVECSKDIGSINIGDGQITTPKLAAGAITADKIAAGQVTTDHIRFTLRTSDPQYEPGKMWYRSDLDELRFASGTTYDRVAQIPKIPLGAPMRQLFWFRSSWLPDNCEKTTIPSGSSGYTTWYSDYVEIGTGSTANSTCRLLKKWLSLKTTWDKKRIVSCLILTGALNSQRLRIWSGTDFQSSGKPSFGVYVDNNSDNYSATIYGFAWNGTSVTTITLGTLNSFSEYLITMEFTPGVSLKFYINGNLVGTITSNLPSGATNSETAFNIEIFNYSSSNKIVYLFQVACMQEL